MFVCPLYNADRHGTKLLPRYYRVNPSVQKFIHLMNETNPRLINRTDKFIYKSFKSRTAYFSQFDCDVHVYIINVLYSKFPPMNCSTEVVCVVWYIINVQNARVSQLMLFVASCHCNYDYIFSCTGLWPYRV